MKYTLKKGYHQRVEAVDEEGRPKRIQYRPGDEIELTRAEAEKLADRIEPVMRFDKEEEPPEQREPVVVEVSVPADDSDDSEDSSEDSEDDSVRSLLDDHAARVRSQVSELTDVDRLAALYDEESRDRARATVLSTIHERLLELAGD